MLVSVPAPHVAILVSVVIAVIREAISATMLTLVDTFPAVDIEHAIPREVSVPANTIVLVPVPERLVSFQPVRHLLRASLLEMVVG